MVDPFVAGFLHVQLRAEGPLVGLALGPLVDQRALHARERRGLGVALDEVLADLDAHELEQEAQVPDHGIVAQHRVARLVRVAPAQADEEQAHQGQQSADVEGHPGEERQQEAHGAGQPGRVAHGKMLIELVQPGVHAGVSLGRPASRAGLCTRIVAGRCGHPRHELRRDSPAARGFPRRADARTASLYCALRRFVPDCGRFNKCR